MSDKRYTCPMCVGEGMLSVKEVRGDPFEARIGLAAIILALLFGASFLYWVTKPRTPTPMEQCANSCGAGRFKTYTEIIPSWVESVKGSDPDISHPPLPAKCECVEAVNKESQGR